MNFEQGKLYVYAAVFTAFGFGATHFLNEAIATFSENYSSLVGVRDEFLADQDKRPARIAVREGLGISPQDIQNQINNERSAIYVGIAALLLAWLVARETEKDARRAAINA